MLEAFFPFSESTFFFTLIGLGLFLLYARDGRVITWFHLDLLMMLCWVALPDYEVGDLEVTMMLGWLPLFYWIPRLGYLLWRPTDPAAEVRIRSPLLVGLLLLALGYVVFINLMSPFPYGSVGEYKYHLSDSAMMGYRGADLILEGRIPYPDDPERGSNFPYGPAYFLLYVPIAYFFPEDDPYRSYCLGARVLTILALSLGALAAFLIGRKARDTRAGLGLALFWLASPYLHNSAYWSQTSHLLPGVFTLVALALALRSPWAGGAALGVNAATAYFPILFVPFWARAMGRRWWQFCIAFCAVMLIFFLPIVLAEDGLTRFLSQVLWGETATRSSGAPWSRWSPWAQYPALMPVRQGLRLGFGLLLVALFGWSWWSRRKPFSLRDAAVASALVVAAFQSWKLHAPGRYHLWLFPLLLVACLWPRSQDSGRAA